MLAASTELLGLLDGRVAEIARSRQDLAEPLSVGAELIRVALTCARPPLTPAFALPREQVAARAQQGIPLLHDQPVQLDVHFAADLFSRLVNCLQARDDPELQPRLTALVGATTSGTLDPERLFSEAFVQHQDHLTELAVAADTDPELLVTLAKQAVGPLLASYAERLLPLLERLDDGSLHGARWTRGYCPICGAWPLLGELRGVELAQWLRCGACGSGWRSAWRLCPYCGSEDYHTLGTLAVTDEQRFRIKVCQHCQGYLKLGNAVDPLPAALLALDDVASRHLDVAAIERGYHRPSGAGSSIELAIADAEWLEELA